MQCLSNLRQLATAANSYATNNHGFYPPAYYSASDSINAYGFNWDFTYVLNLTTGQRTVISGLIWQGQTDPRIQQCPSFIGRSNTLADPDTGYNYNTSYIGHGDQEMLPNQFISPAKLNQVRRGARKTRASLAMASGQTGPTNTCDRHCPHHSIRTRPRFPERKASAIAT